MVGVTLRSFPRIPGLGGRWPVDYTLRNCFQRSGQELWVGEGRQMTPRRGARALDSVSPLDSELLGAQRCLLWVCAFGAHAGTEH